MGSGLFGAVQDRLRGIGHQTTGTGPLGLGLFGAPGGILSNGGVVGAVRSGLASSPLLNPARAASASAVQKWNSEPAIRSVVPGANVDHIGPGGSIIFADARTKSTSPYRRGATTEQVAQPNAFAPVDRTPTASRRFDKVAWSSAAPTPSLKEFPEGGTPGPFAPVYHPTAPGLSFA